MGGGGQQQNKFHPQLYGASTTNVVTPSLPYQNQAPTPGMVVSDANPSGLFGAPSPGSTPTPTGSGSGMHFIDQPQRGIAGRPGGDENIANYFRLRGGNLMMSQHIADGWQPGYVNTSSDNNNQQSSDNGGNNSGNSSGNNSNSGSSDQGVNPGWIRGVDGSYYYYGPLQSAPTDTTIPGQSGGFSWTNLFPFH